MCETPSFLGFSSTSVSSLSPPPLHSFRRSWSQKNLGSGGRNTISVPHFPHLSSSSKDRSSMRLGRSKRHRHALQVVHHAPREGEGDRRSPRLLREVPQQLKRLHEAPRPHEPPADDERPPVKDAVRPGRRLLRVVHRAPRDVVALLQLPVQLGHVLVLR